jgi:amino acid adenylation domain-containing protein
VNNDLASLVRDAAARDPDAIAVRAPDGVMTYGALDRAADRVARALLSLGVRPGDRVGVWTEKSARTVAIFQGVLRAGAAYVPADPLSPAVRIGAILRDCGVSAVATSAARAAQLRATGVDAAALLTDTSAGDGPPLAPGPSLSWADVEAIPATPLERADAPGGDALAYILYTSGSTGRPKGVAISHDNALAFVRWAAEEIQARPGDRLSSHAPFHFDLSVLDLYVAFCAGAAVCVIPEWTSYSAKRLVSFVLSERITVWYSVPSALMLMMDGGGLLDAPAPDLRAILFAGEVFPIGQLSRLRRHFSRARLLNLYGPTETNVCAFHEVGDLGGGSPPAALPIGRACSGDRVWAVDERGAVIGPGEEGELVVEGPTVMLGYWGQPPQAGRPYATGDIVRLRQDGAYELVGRRDQMVKVRGNRVELGEIEATLGAHPDIKEAAVAVEGDGMEARLIACVVPVGERSPPLLAVKKHCAERLPRYMIPDEVRVLDALPRTGNGKVDRRSLTARMRGRTDD